MSRTVLVAKILALPLIKKEIFYRDVQMAIGKTVRQETVRPAFLTITSKAEGIQLRRCTGKGESVGDTCHSSVEEAKDQARHEFGGHYSEWQAVSSKIAQSASEILEHFKAFESFYRVTLRVEKIPPLIGPKLASAIVTAFKARPWNKNVVCLWDFKRHFLAFRADHPYDDKGVVVGTELVDEIVSYLKVRYLDERAVIIVAVDSFHIHQDSMN